MVKICRFVFLYGHKKILYYVVCDDNKGADMFYTDWYDATENKIKMRAFEKLPKSIRDDVNNHADGKKQRRPTVADIYLMLASLLNVYFQNKQDDTIVSVIKSVLTELGTAIRLNATYRKAITEEKQSVVKFAALFSLVFGTNSNYVFCKELYPALTKGLVDIEIYQYKRAFRFEKHRLAMEKQVQTR